MFKKAERKQAKLRLGLVGPSGSGKTYSALRIAGGIGGKVALIDTENKSASLYAPCFDFDVAEIEPPYTIEKYISAIAEAEKAGYTTIIIDSLSHAWCGQGGLLEEVDKRSKNTVNNFAAWRDITPMHNKFVDAILHSSCHVIATMRSKTAYDLVKDEKSGKMKPVKVGLAPVQRDGMEYEFTSVFDVEIDSHLVTASKDRTNLFDGKVFVPTEETGEELLEWLNAGNEIQMISDEQFKKLQDLGVDMAALSNVFKVASVRALTFEQAEKAIEAKEKQLSNKSEK